MVINLGDRLFRRPQAGAAAAISFANGIGKRATFFGRGEPESHDTAFSVEQLMAIDAITVRQLIAIHWRCCHVCPKARSSCSTRSR
jgi:hypothetical protein